MRRFVGDGINSSLRTLAPVVSVSTGVPSQSYLEIFQSDGEPDNATGINTWFNINNSEVGIRRTSSNIQSLFAKGMASLGRGIFGGGYISSVINSIEHITINSVGNANDFGDLTEARHYLAACSNGEMGRGVFGGGYTNTAVNTLDYITINTGGAAADYNDLCSVNKEGCCSSSDGKRGRGFFQGGKDEWNNTIEYITISTTGQAAEFGTLNGIRYYSAACTNGSNSRALIIAGLHMAQ